MSGRYTADAVALYHYLADTLPDDADDVVARAEAGVCVVEVPSTTMAEVLYGVARTEKVGGVPLEVSATATQRGLLDEGPFELVDATADEIAVFGSLADHLSLHDALVVASHRERDTEAILTNDPEIGAVASETIWN